MTLEYLNEKKEMYQQKQSYFENIGFDVLAADFQSVVDLIEQMENYIKEKENGRKI
jgi:hypothetical protein